MAMGTRRAMTLKFALATVALVAVAGCTSEAEVDSSVDPKSHAEQMIADDLATNIGLGPLIGICSETGPMVVGSAFGCTATTESGEVIQVHGEINPDGRIELITTNLVSAAALPSFEREAAAALNQSTGSNLTAESVDCGDSAIVLPSDFVLPCALAMPASGDVFDLTLTVTDLDERRFSLVVGEQPRP